MNRNHTIEQCKTFAERLQDAWSDLTDRRLKIAARKMDRWIDKVQNREREIGSSLRNWAKQLAGRATKRGVK